MRPTLALPRQPRRLRVAQNLRTHLHSVLDAAGTLPAVVHKNAVVAPGVSVGQGSVLMAGAIVNSGSRIGDFVVVNTGATVNHDSEIGAGTHLCPGVHLGGNVRCGRCSYVGIGASVLQGIHIGDRGNGRGAALTRIRRAHLSPGRRAETPRCCYSAYSNRTPPIST